MPYRCDDAKYDPDMLQATRGMVIIPAFNEAAALSKVIADISARIDCDVTVINDGSSDDTAAVAQRAGATVLSHCCNQGVGAALRTGLRFATQTSRPWVVQIDGDGQHPVEAVEHMLAHLGHADMVLGYRDWSTYPASVVRRVAVRLMRLMLGVHGLGGIADPTSGFRVFGPRAIEVFATEMPSQYLGDTVEALLIARRHKLTIAQVAVQMRSREAGVPSQSTLNLVRALLRTASFVMATPPRGKDR